MDEWMEEYNIIEKFQQVMNDGNLFLLRSLSRSRNYEDAADAAALLPVSERLNYSLLIGSSKSSDLRCSPKAAQNLPKAGG